MTSTWFFFSSWPIGFWLFFSFLQSTELLSKIPLRLESLAVFCAFVSVLHQRLFPRERQNRNKRVNWDGAYRADKLDVDELPDCCWSKMGWGAVRDLSLVEAVKNIPKYLLAIYNYPYPCSLATAGLTIIHQLCLRTDGEENVKSSLLS